MSELQLVQRLVDELQKDGHGKANNVLRLLHSAGAGAGGPSNTETVVKTAIQGLKVFFMCAFHEGHLSVDSLDLAVDRPLDADKFSDAADTGAVQVPAEQVYSRWLRRQYSVYMSMLHGHLMRVDAAPGVQVCAAIAIFEAVRCIGGPGSFSEPTFSRLLACIVTRPSVKPEVYTLLFTRFLPFADVRYYTFKAVKVIAQRAKTRDTSKGVSSSRVSRTIVAEDAGAENAAAGVDADADGVTAGVVAAASADIDIADLSRNLYDVLVHVPDSISEDPAQLSSWSGTAEVGLLAPGIDRNESARARRKRKADTDPNTVAADQNVSLQQRAVWANIKNQRRAFGDAWLSLLALPIPADVLRKVLLRLHASVMPSMPRPVMLADFLTHALDGGGLVGMLALNGLFVLVTQHGLEYPQFFERLYQLVTADALASKHRSHFFKLADLFLSSGLVPAYTAAAFIKRFARLGMTASPPGAMICIAFIHNLLRRHPACMVLLHNPAAGTRVATATHAATHADQGDSAGTQGQHAHSSAPAAVADSSRRHGGSAGEDVYDASEPDPAKSRAVESSLWEVACLRNHYCPQVSAFAAILDKDLSDRKATSEVSVAELLPNSYGSLLRAEVGRRLKKVSTAFYAQPLTHLVSGADVVGWAVE